MHRCPRIRCLLPFLRSHHDPARLRLFSSASSPPPVSNSGSPSDDEWDQAWESAWLPDHLTPLARSPWEADVHFPDSLSVSTQVVLPVRAEAEDHEAKAFLEEMDERWDERRMAARDRKNGRNEQPQKQKRTAVDDVLEGPQLSASATGEGRDPDEEYRLRKQRIHASLWMKEIERMEEAHLADAAGGDIDRLLDSCAEIFDPGQDKLDNTTIPSTSEFKTKPDGWEATSQTPDGNIWEVTQREEGVLLQEFERRIAFSKFQIASFIKTHIFSRRRPIDGWKYMIEELGPNARKTKGSVQRLPSLSDSSTQPYMEERTSIGSNFTPYKHG